MKWSRILSLSILCLTAVAASAQTIVVGTFNLRYANAHDTGDLWEDRLPMVADIVRFHEFDILGTQEGLHRQLVDVYKTCEKYEFYGVGRDDGAEVGEHSAIFYRADRFRAVDKGDFWLSATPDRPSFGWDAKCCKRLCTWVKLYDRQAQQAVWVFNAHYDHEGQQARRESSKLVLRKIEEMAQGDKVILMGDLNATRDSEPYGLIARSGLLKDSYSLATAKLEGNPSYHAFGKQLKGSDVIDHIFIKGKFKVARWSILSNSFHGKFPSDHFPVMAELQY
ncbi:endonuclease/exonuclease/phosphatase family protein [Nemorincola caseinilytica]|uniref:Endonuclease/exonuclease/phosphatase family protein n=1 Tax=Nemorincola caseinilytica TaxID=2054315 RepID=A0ABP8NRX9_9BACT